ncbi:penicillin acylase family protein [Agarivorans sp. QJM3NY_25]|uniref:penicillin acylase family protein n=1 Tax=Agarivorans sp. QJM3NY_25 TaxID=3421430 RepID=UPI003D7DA1E5
MSAFELLTEARQSMVFRDQQNGNLVEIQWSDEGVPHIKAKDYKSLGFGYGYAHALDRLCELSGQVIALRGERSKYFGAEQIATIGFLKTSNLNSDLMYRIRMPDNWVQQALDSLDPRSLDYIGGYVAGLNYYAESLDQVQRRELFKQEPMVSFELADVIRSTMRFGVMKELVEIGPALLASTCKQQPIAQNSAHSKPVKVEGGFGSNAWAYGGDVVAGNGGLLVGNPHSAWKRSPHQIRIYMHQYHLTIPGEIDVAGASFLGFPIPMTGYNANVSWTILDAAAVTAFVFQAMDVEINQQAASYVMDGVRKPLERQTVSIEVLEESGVLATRHYDFFKSELGLLYKLPASRARPAGWYAITNAGEANARGLDQFLAAARSSSTREFVRAIEQHRGILSQLLIADRHGDVAYTVAGNVLPISDELMQQYHLGEKSLAFNVLDGSRSEASFRDELQRPLQAPVEFFPKIISRGILHNTNNSYKYTEYGLEQVDYPSVFGQHKRLLQADRKYAAGLSYDPRLIMSARRMKELIKAGNITAESALQVIFDNRNYAAETFLDALLALANEECSAEAKLAFKVLSSWDRRNNADSKGALLFHQFWLRIVALELLSISPCGNPELGSQMRITPESRHQIIDALEAAVMEITTLGFALDVAWGEVLYQTADQQRIAMHGGCYQEGVLNGEMPAPLSQQGFPYILFGSAYIQCVFWRDQQVVPYVLLSHGQRDGIESIGRTKQLKLFSDKQLYHIPYAPAEAPTVADDLPSTIDAGLTD